MRLSSWEEERERDVEGEIDEEQDHLLLYFELNRWLNMHSNASLKGERGESDDTEEKWIQWIE